MTDGFTYTVTGLDELLAKVDPGKLLGPALKEFFNTATQSIKNEVKDLTPVGLSGQLKSSISTEVDSGDIPLWGKVGPSVNYAPFVEFDTKPHWTSVHNLEAWASAKGLNPFMVQRAIAAHGTKGAHMFEQGLDNSRDHIDDLVYIAGQKIEGTFST